jgi:hypothetical protein
MPPRPLASWELDDVRSDSGWAARADKRESQVLHFPFSDLSETKRRPALVPATLSGDDVILCQITSQSKSDEYSLALDPSDFASGNLNRPRGR